MRSFRIPFALSVACLGFSALRCAGSTSSGGDGGHTVHGVPAVHRATAQACAAARGPGYNSDAGVPDGGYAGLCSRDADCTSGNNGRCQGSRMGYVCNYDQCFQDADCGGTQVCDCGDGSGVESRSPHRCVSGNCRLDADCGTGGYCSPSLDFTCGAYGGLVGYYCHTAHDECASDADCANSDGGFGPGFCAWQPTTSKWQCSHGMCAG